MAERTPSADKREALATAVRDACAGAADVAWLDKLVRDAGYAPASDALAAFVEAARARHAACPHCLTWRPLSVAAHDIGSSEKTLRNWAKRSAEALPVRQQLNKPHAQPGVAYEYAKRYAGKSVGNLHPPPGCLAAALGTAASSADACATAAPTDPHALLQAIISRPDLQAQFSPQLMLAFRAIASELRLKAESDAASEQLVKPDAVARMMEDLHAVYVQEVDGSAPADAASLCKYLLAQLAVDLAKSNIAAPQIIEVWLRERANRVLERIAANVNDQLHGVRTLELSAAPPPAGEEAHADVHAAAAGQ